jgi:hypothetical protein
VAAIRVRDGWLVAVLVAIVVGIFGVMAFQRPMAPDVTFTTLSDDKITIQSLRGKVVWVNF